MPTTLSLATPPRAVMPAAPIWAVTARSTDSALGKSAWLSVKEMSVAPRAETFCTIMSMTTRASASALNTAAAVPGRSGTPSTVTLAWFFSTLTPRITTFSMPGASSVIMVPGLSLKLERTSNFTPNFLANSTERDCMTLLPLLAISSISS